MHTSEDIPYGWQGNHSFSRVLLGGFLRAARHYMFEQELFNSKVTHDLGSLYTWPILNLVTSVKRQR